MSKAALWDVATSRWDVWVCQAIVVCAFLHWCICSCPPNLHLSPRGGGEVQLCWGSTSACPCIALLISLDFTSFMGCIESSCGLLSGVKQHRIWYILGEVTTREHQMLLASFYLIVAVGHIFFWPYFQPYSWFGSMPAVLTCSFLLASQLAVSQLEPSVMASTAFLIFLWFMGLLVPPFLSLGQPHLLPPCLFMF